MLLAFIGFLAAQNALSQPARSVSPSRQFVIYGDDVRMRGAVSGLAEETKRNLLSLLHASDDWQIPIVINLQVPQANVPELPSSRLNFSQTGAGLKIQLDLVVTPDFQAERLQRQVLRVLLLERIYRHRGDLAVGAHYVEPPAWLLTAILAESAPAQREDVPLPSTLPALADFLTVPSGDLESQAQALYRTYSVALIQLLAKGDGQSSDRLSRYIESLATPSGDALADLKAFFPSLSATDLETEWQGKVRADARAEQFELLSFSRTERQLNELLSIQAAGKTEPLARFFKAKLTPGETAAVRSAAQGLMLLGIRAHPLLRPIIAEYQEVAELLGKGKGKGAKERLARLHTLQSRLSARMNELDDYMNWFEGTQATAPSGAFDNYLHTATQADAGSRRHDALSVYLDAVAFQLQN